MPHRRVTPCSKTGEPGQAAAIALLGDPVTHGVKDVVRIDTPISHVFIAGPKTYKLKRSVKRNFVDYSTVELRKKHCQREFEVNSIFAPGIYQGVVAIVRASDGLRLGGKGEVIDYVVEMTSFDPARTLDCLAQTGELSREVISEFADTIAAIHQAAPAAAQFGGSDKISRTIEQVAEAIAVAPVGDLLNAEISAWQQAADAALARHRKQIDARRRHGCVRRCHGDLHLSNICMFEGHPTPFDAIEFSEEVASVDVFYDLAFTVMDLLRNDLKSHANSLIARYLNITRDYSALSLLPLFVSLRAAVRAMVAASGDDTSAALHGARTRLEFAQRCLQIAPEIEATRRPMLIAIGGLSGSGKSTLARALAPQLDGLCGAVTIRSDVCRKRLFSVAPEAPLPRSAYRAEVSQRVYTLMMRDAARALRSGTSVILDATFIEGEKTRNLDALAGRAGATFAGLWLSLDLAALQQRISARGADASDATPAVAADQWQSVRENPAWTKLDASRSPNEVAAEARAAIGQ